MPDRRCRCDLFPRRRIYLSVAGLGNIQPDAELLAAAARGDRAARERLYLLVAPAVHGFARRIVSRTAADDIMQDTLIALFEHLHGFRGDCPFGLWVRRIALTRCLMHLRSPWQRLRIVPGRAVAEDAAPGAPVGDLLDLQRALDSLPAVARAVLWMHAVEGCTHEEIARAFGRSVSFSKSQLARAQSRVRGSGAVEAHDLEEAACMPTMDCGR